MRIFLTLFTIMISFNSWSRGKLLLIGGGERPAIIIKEIVNFSQGQVLIIPLASEIPQEVAAGIKGQLETEGAQGVKVFSCDHDKRDLPICLEEIRQTRLVFFTGGSQIRLLDGLKNTKSLQLIKERFEEGLSLAGTSAGTAVMSEVMITGNTLAPYNSFNGIRPHMVETRKGFGFLKKIVIDQHFLKRGRENRLISTVLDNPGLIGVGVDESTAIIINEDESFSVLGEGATMIIDSRKAEIEIKNSKYKVKNLLIHLLTTGEEFKF